MPRYRVTLAHVDKEKMLDLVRKYKIQILDHSQSSQPGDHRVDAIAQPAEIQQLLQAGYQVQQHEDVDELAKARQQEVGKGNRYGR